jgi:hypothetical protein
MGLINKYLIKNYPERWIKWYVKDMDINLGPLENSSGAKRIKKSKNTKELSGITIDGVSSAYVFCSDSPNKTGFILNYKDFSNKNHPAAEDIYNTVVSEHDRRGLLFNDLDNASFMDLVPIGWCKLFIQKNKNTKLEESFIDATIDESPIVWRELFSAKPHKENDENMKCIYEALLISKSGSIKISKIINLHKATVEYNSTISNGHKTKRLNDKQSEKVIELFRRHNSGRKFNFLKQKVKSCL